MADGQKTQLKLALDYRIIIGILLVVIGVMLFLWKPWAGYSSDRTISVTGEATIEAEPDEFVFYPSYEFEGEDKDALLKSMTEKNDAIVARLKELGVDESDIENNANNYDMGYYYARETGTTSHMLQLTISVGSRDMAQKVQDYLLTTQPNGAVTPRPAFSDAKRKELESQARDEATKEARRKADQSASNLGFKVGKVKTIEDSAGFGVSPMYGIEDTAATRPATAPEASSLLVLPGKNELSYSVSVTYYLR